MNAMFAKVSRGLSVLAVTAMVCLPAHGFAASPDSILSGDIKEADGTSGQDSNTGAGIKTGHIQNGAITTDKIQDLHVTTGKIADGAVSDAKLGDNAVITSKILDLAVTSPKLADGAVTDIKITGPISASKIENGVFQKKYANILIVAKSGGDFTDPLTAVQSITDASPENRYLIKIMPGTYNIGSNSIHLYGYIDIEGSGKYNTKITGSDPIYGTIASQGEIEIRQLTIENTGGNACPVQAWDNLTIKDAVLLAEGGTTGHPLGLSINPETALNLENVEIIANGDQGTGLGIMGENHKEIIINNVLIKVNTLVLGRGVTMLQYVNLKADRVNVVVESPLAWGIILGSSYYSTAEDVRLQNVTVDLTVPPSNSTPYAATAVYISGAVNLEITNSRFSSKVNSGDNTAARMISVHNYANSNNVKIAGSLIGNGVDGVAKIVNCFDSNFNVIPNQ